LTDNVKLTIDGVEVEVPKGTLVIRAAEMIGKYVPRFCDHPLLDPLGACRQCMVEVEGQRKPLTACTTTVTEGMVVKTQMTSDLAREAQDGVLELLLINHPLDCPMCDKGGECPLQDQTLAYGPGGSRYVDAKRRYVKPVPVSPLVRLDRERCVLCARCTRFADQIAGDPFIELFERGALEQVAIFEDEPYESIFSGNVVQICPVGALTSTAFRFRARPFDMTSVPGTCNRCASGCSISVQERRGELVRVLANENLDVNDEWICDKGRFAYAYAQRGDRVTEPLVRKGDEFVAVSWAEAVDAVVRGLSDARAAGKGGAVLGGQQLFAEDAYALSRFARTVLGTNDVDCRNYASTGDEEEDVLGAHARSAGATNADVDAARAIVVAGADLHEESPILFLRLRKAARRGCAITEIGPRRTLARIKGSRWIPATDVASALASVEAADVVLAGERLARTPGALLAAWNFARERNAKFGWVPRKAGARGALEAGLYPALLPGGRRADDAEARAQVAAAWGVEPPSATGRDAQAILEGARDLGFLLLAGADPVNDFAAPASAAASAVGAHGAAPENGVARALEGAPFVVAIDLFLTESALRAHVVLPAAAAYERNGTLLNWEARAGENVAAVPARGLAQSDHEILAHVARAAGFSFPSTLDDVREEMASLARPPRDAEPLAPWKGSAAAKEGLVLASAPALLDAGTMMLGADQLLETAALRVAELHPDDAAALGIVTGDRVTVGEHALSALVTPNVARGVVYVAARTGRELAGIGEPVTVTKA
jgi:NADH-quinone oxidoreductase subunit G